MNIFTKIFNQRKPFVAYITAGHGGLDYSLSAACALVAGGVDILEIGVPFSDPIADGPVIQHAMNLALQDAVTLSSVFKLIADIKACAQVPIIVFCYYNPLLAMGFESALQAAAKAGVDGFLVVDLPLEESEAFFNACREHKIEPVCLLSPTTDADRIKQLSDLNDSFLYYVCRNGTTGIQASMPQDYPQKVTSIKSIVHQPVVAGFGIGDRNMAALALKHADGFVVGSAFVSAITDGASPTDLTKLAINIDPR